MTTRPRILVRPPSGQLEDGELTHLERQPVDAALARTQWDAYRAAFTAHGWEVQQIEAAEDQPDGVFVEDVVVMVDDAAILTSPGADSRRGEVESMARALEALREQGEPITVHQITAPGTLEGGDVLKVGSTVYVGRSSRTNDEGIAQLTAIVEPLGRTVVTVPLTMALHLKTAVTALPDGTVIGYEPIVDDPSIFPRFLAVPEAEGTAVVVLDETTVLLSAHAPQTAELLRARGLTVVTTPVTEFEKLEGCVTCLSVRLR
ncbi:dimethylargininase [Actinotalea sp. C106]|uniref:dimethylargininase n=1 Tax=Actinotalea sp. C106 TaxID=2908644 RepID=UPI002027E3D0|nr:dimethylargininase [Actinotalea sp. C106]